MSKTEKIGSDGYSREAFQSGLEGLQESGIPYQPPSEERTNNSDWNELYQAATTDEQKIVDGLDRLHANAMRDAEKIELLARVEEEKDELHNTIAQYEGIAPDGVLNEARDVIKMGEQLAGVLKGKESQPRSLIEQLIIKFREAKGYITKKLRQFLGAQNRYGDPLQPI